MNRVIKWILSHKNQLALGLFGTLLLVWALSHRTVALIACVVIWFGHLGLGVVAVMAGVRVWRSRHIPFFNYLWFYLNAFVIDVLSAIAMLFVARGVKFTWKFTAVMFISTLLMDAVRIPLLFSIIRGPKEGTPVEPKPKETNGALPPAHWEQYFERMVEQNKSIERRLNDIDDEIKKLKRNGEVQNEK